MKILDDFLREYVNPVTGAAGFRKRGREYGFAISSGDSVFLTFSATRIDSEACVFFALCSFVPEPYWKWLNRKHVRGDLPRPDSSGALAAYSVLPPETCAHAPTARGLGRARWAFDRRNRPLVGSELATRLEREEIPAIARRLQRPGLLAEITSARSPSVRCWGAVQSELVLMVDDYTSQQRETLLATSELDDAFRQEYRDWVRKWEVSDAAGHARRRRSPKG